MKTLITIMVSMMGSVLVVGILYYFNLFPHLVSIVAPIVVESGEATQEARVNSKVENAGDDQLLKEIQNTNQRLTQKVNKESACRQANEIMNQIKEQCGSMPFPGTQQCIQMRKERANVELRESNLARAQKMGELQQIYELAQMECNSEQN